MSRPTRDQTFMEICDAMSKRSTCERRSVGCVIVDKDGYILSTGYNGVPQHVMHCDSLECYNGEAAGQDISRCNAIHAEQNAIARLRQPLQAHTIYCTTEPCESCLKLLLATSIERVVYRDPYPGTRRLVKLSGLKWEKFNDDERIIQSSS